MSKRVFATLINSESNTIRLLVSRSKKDFEQSESWIDERWTDIALENGNYLGYFDGAALINSALLMRKEAAAHTIANFLSCWLIYAEANNEPHEPFYDIDIVTASKLLDHPLILEYDKEQEAQKHIEKQHELATQQMNEEKKNRKEFPIVDKAALAAYLREEIESLTKLEQSCAQCKDYDDAMRHMHYQEAFNEIIRELESGKFNAKPE